ncbi:MAG: hypothetical protein ACLQME_17375 [Alphaproteobacteria bacterium]
MPAGSFFARRGLASGIAGLSAVALAMAAVYARSFDYPTFNPEHALSFAVNDGLTWRGLLDRYLDFTAFFYRPTDFYVYYQLMSRLAGWHDIAAYRAAAFVLLFAFGVGVYGLAITLMEGDRLAASAAAVFAVVHPLMFTHIYEAVGFYLINHLCVISAAVLFCGRAFAGRWGKAWLALAVVLYLVALTSKEQSIALPGFLLLVLLIERLLGPISAEARLAEAERRRLRRRRVTCFLLIAALSVAYLRLVFFPHYGLAMFTVSHDPAAAYRVAFNPQIVLSNLVSGPFGVAHIFKWPMVTWGMTWIQDNPWNTVFGAALLAAIAWHVGTAALKRDRPELASFAVLLALFMAAAVPPIISGGRPWHYVICVAAYAVMAGRAFAVLARRVAGQQRAVLGGALLVSFAVVVVMEHGNFAREVRVRMPLFKLNAEAMQRPPVAPAAMPRGATILYSVKGHDGWDFGDGNLFRLVYLDATIHELQVPDAEHLSLEMAREWLSARNAYYFAYDPARDPPWRDETARFAAMLAADRPSGSGSAR